MLDILTLTAACILPLFGRCCSLGRLVDETLSGDTSMLQHGIVFPSSDDDGGDVGGVCNGTALQCIRLSSCHADVPNRTGSKRVFPEICGWEVTEPKVCCNPAAITSEQPPIAAKQTKLKDQFDKNDCAVVRSFRSDSFKIAVVGGEDVENASKWPFMVAIFIVLGDEKFFLCGGSLISRTIVLCAAHCFENRIESDTHVVRMGTVELNPSAAAAILEVGVAEVIVHEHFVPPSLDNDVAILKLSGPGVNYSDTVRPVCLPSDASLDESNVFVNVIGWGSKESGGAASQILQQVTLPVVSNAECNKTYAFVTAARTALPNGITESKLCAGDVNGTKDACQGDSGGPLVVTDSSSRWTQVGIVSGGIGCGTPGIPGIYSRVSQYIQWIRSKA